MEEPPNNRSVLVPAGLLIGLASLLIIAAFALLSGIEPPEYIRQANPSPASAVAQAPVVTNTSTSTVTSSATPRPTITLMPSRTPTDTRTPSPTPTATRERVPTLTAAIPNRINQRYGMATLTAEEMDRITRLVSDSPDAKYRPTERDTAEYNAYFIYPAIAFREALLRFPQAEHSNRWRWGLAYSLVRLGDPHAVAMIQDFLLEALNRERIPTEDLPSFLKENAPDLTLTIHPLDLLPGQPEFKLLEISQGQMVYLLWEYLTDKFRLYPLKLNFEFSRNREIVFTTLDMDGNGLKELVIYQAETASDTPIASPQIFRLEPLPPNALSVQAEMPKVYKPEHSTTLSAITNSDGSQSLQVSAEFIPSCPFSIMRRYDWIEQQAVLGAVEYELLPQADLLSYCEAALEQSSELWDVTARLEILNKLLPLWPPASDPQGRPYFKEEQDKLRFQLAVSLALNGNLTEANAALSELIATPADGSGDWLQAAATFQRSLAGDGLYLACQASAGCDLHAALRQILSASAVNEPAQALAALQAAGAAVRSSGRFDFDQDDVEEVWLTIQPRSLAKLEFWILSRSASGIRAVFVTTSDFTGTKPYWSDSQAYPGVFQIASRQGFMFQRLPDNQEPYLVSVAVEPLLTTYTRDAIWNAEQDLLNGRDAAAVRDNLLEVFVSGRFNCKTVRLCDRFIYILGLAYELAGDTGMARDTYIQLWWENRLSPLTTAARLKLIYLPGLATPTAMRTPTMTPSITSTPSATPSPTPTP